MKTLIHTTSNIFYHFLLSNQKETSNKFRPRNIFISIYPYTLLIFYQTKKEQANKSALENYFCHFCNTQTHSNTYDHCIYT